MTSTRQLPGSVALVLHAHLPWVRHPEHAHSLEERWLYEAMWECYLPLVDVLDRAASHRRPAKPLCTISISSTLATMLRDPHHRGRFSAFCERMRERIGRIRASETAAPFARGIAAHAARLEASLVRFERCGCDLTRAFAELSERGVVELGTTSATHAYLPGLRSHAAVRAQLRLGMRHHRAVFGREPEALWLPECGYDERIADDVAASGARFTVLESHGVALGRPRPAHAPLEPVIGPGGVAYFGRDTELVGRVWSRAHGYPGDPVYREFHRDLGTHAPELLSPDDLDARGPHGERLAVGLRPWAVTGTEQKSPYDPGAAELRARHHAEAFARLVDERLRASEAASPVSVLAFDAELFGHWWWEGPAFLEALFERLDGDAGRPELTSLGGYLARDPALPVSLPAASSWGEGGFGDVWASPKTAHLFRIGQRATRRLLHVDSIVRDEPCSERQRSARVLAIREALLFEASDWPFMIRANEFPTYALARLRAHADHVEKLTAVAERWEEHPDDRALFEAISARGIAFGDLDDDAFADAFDPW